VPLIGFLPFFVLLLALYADVRLPKLPATLLPVFLGVVMSWLTGYATLDHLTSSVDHLGWHPTRLTFTAFQSVREVLPYIAVTVPVAFTVSVGTIQCQQLAASVGDEYSLRASMLGDGIATIIAALCGSPYGMTVFIGHSAFKGMGAQIGYNLLGAAAMVIVAFTGLTSVLLAAIPVQALNPILLFVGLAVCTDALRETPERHWAAFLLSLVPAFCNWACQQAQSFGRVICAHQPGGCAVDVDAGGAWTLDPTGSLRGLYALGQGYLLTSIYLAGMLVFCIDREFTSAGIYALVAAASASCGLIHSETVFLPWTKLPMPSGPVVESQWDRHWDFVGTYVLCGAVFFACAALQRLGKLPRGDQHSSPEASLREASSSFVQGSSSSSLVQRPAAALSVEAVTPVSKG